jgi:O-antigen/teichoic acid export membrane protein
MTGTTIGQAIPIAIAPILSRIYTPTDFGALAVFLAIANLIAIGAGGAYEQAILLPADDREARVILRLSLLLTTAVSTVTLLAIVCGRAVFTDFLEGLGLGGWLYWVPLAVILTGWCQAFNYWSTRRQRYSAVARSRVVQATGTSALNVAAGIARHGSGGLIAGGLLGQLLSLMVLGRAAWRDKDDAGVISRAELVRVGRQYGNFPRYVLPHGLLDHVRESGLTLLIAQMLGGGVLGYFAFATRLLRTPLGLIGSSVAQVFYQRAAAAYASGAPVRPLLRGVVFRLVLIAIPAGAVLAFFGPALFGIVFGAEWEIAGHYARLLAPWFLVNFVSSPVSHMPSIVGRQRDFFRVSALYNLLIPATFFCTVTIGLHPTHVFVAVSLVGAFYLAGILMWIARLTSATGWSVEAPSNPVGSSVMERVG